MTFHSLEDRIVKQFFVSRSGRGRAASRRLPGEPAEAQPTFEAPRRQPVEPSEAEALANPRSRSAKLRFGVRTGAPPRAIDETIEALARLPARREEKNLMWRFMHAAAIAALIGSAAYVYGVKYQTIYASEQLVKTRHLIDKEKNAINLLRAEFAHLARPDRIQALADSKLGLEPLALSQIARIEELPDAQPKVDLIGRTLELLGFTADNSTPAVTAADLTPPAR